MRYDVIIVGGGVIGCAVARELTRFRLDALLVDREPDVGFGTSKANSGIIHGGHHAEPGTLKAELGWEGNRAWDGLAAELGFGFEQTGDLTVAFTEAEVAVLEELRSRGVERGIEGLELWGPGRIRREEPNLSDEILAALFAPQAGVVNPYEACFALVESARRNGLDLALGHPVTAIDRDAEGFTVATGATAHHARVLVNAAGVQADRIARMVGDRSFTLRFRKGEEYLLDKRLDGIVRRIIFPCPSRVSKGVLVIPTFDGTIMVGPTADEVDDRSDLATTAAGGDRVFAAASRLVPGISERDCIAEFAGVRAVAGTEDFVIGPGTVPGLVNVAGIQSPGLTAAPAIARRVASLLADQGLPLEPNPGFVAPLGRPVRVAALDPAARAALAASDRRFAHVVCRCELVTEGEIADAVDRGATTLDGLKFRTRAGMGRCQGGFCTWRCMEVLSERLGVPLEAVTKRGGGSWMVARPPDREADR